MEPNEAPRDKLSARTTNRHLIGRDTEGRGHFYSSYLGMVWLMDGDTLVVAHETRDLAGWREYVETRCGWDWHNIRSESTIELAAEAITSEMERVA